VLGLLAAHALAAVLAPVLVRWWGRPAVYLVAAVPAATAGWAAAHTGRMVAGDPVAESYPWAPGIGLELAFRMTTLPWLMALLVGGVGALVLAYSARYFPAGAADLGRFTGLFVGFAGSMFGLVVSDDLLLLYVCWELTTVFSYLLIGHHPARRASRRAAMQALLVTTFGGLAMLVGFVMLGQHAGSYRWSVVAERLPDGGYLAVALVLILLGVLSKSAIFPFSFWLPAAMAAPTPVSAYLHAAAMVKAGVFLVGLVTPELANAPLWRPALLVCGTVTLLFGGWAAVRQSDLKLLLAYGTVSQLGLLIVVLGAGTRDTALAGAAMLLAHALFKAALFLVVGVIDRTNGTRDLRQLTGLGRRMPATAAVAVLALASMVGLPPTIGFVAKEAVFEAFLAGGALDRAVLAGLALGSTLTVAYSLRFLWGGFARKPGLAEPATHRAGTVFLAAPAVLALAGVAAGLAAPAVDRVLAGYADRAGGAPDPYHLALWHGLTPALGWSAAVLLAGTGLFYGTRRTGWWRALRLPVDGASAYRWLMGWLDRLAVELTGATQRGSLPFYLGVILLVLVGFAGTGLVAGWPWPDRARAFDHPLQLVVAGVVIVAAVFAARAQRRLTAMILLGVSGYAVAAIFVLHGAPDLALTQFLVETVTIVMFVLVLRRLPARFSERPLRMVRQTRVAIGVAVGVVVAGLAYVAVNGRQATSISTQFPALADELGGGHNVVNVTLVDIRAWDTMGEISVLVVAATGVASLIFARTQALRRRGAVRPDRPDRPDQGSRWLMAGSGPEAGRPAIILQVATRLIFHVVVLFSIFLLFSGHNAPGGGFAGGLVAGLALAVRYLAGGRAELNVAAPIDAGRLLGTGLFVAVGTGAAALLLGGEVLQSALLDLQVPLLGEVHLVSSVLFDIGVYLIVVGLVLDILRSLGAEVDRQQESGQPGPEPTAVIKELV
jgi:multicomponent Na+:H+ antiporter subunit A